MLQFFLRINSSNLSPKTWVHFGRVHLSSNKKNLVHLADVNIDGVGKHRDVEA